MSHHFGLRSLFLTQGHAIPGWPPTCCQAKDNLLFAVRQRMIFLPPPPTSWNHRHALRGAGGGEEINQRSMHARTQSGHIPASRVFVLDSESLGSPSWPASSSGSAFLSLPSFGQVSTPSCPPCSPETLESPWDFYPGRRNQWDMC